MKGNEEVIAALNEALKMELTAILQYMVHGEMQNNWGYNKLGGYIRKQAIDEMRHAEGLIERILYLDGIPKVDVMPGVKIGTTVQQQIANDHAEEANAIVQYNKFAQLSADRGDNATRDLFVKMVSDEEQHEDWLESQLRIIEEIGAGNYLQQQMGAAGEGH